MQHMKKGLILQLTFIAILWLALCYLLIVSTPFTLKTILLIVGTGIIVFVPLYKKHFRK